MSMTKTPLRALLAATALLAAACTHNDGDIGDLYGRWQLTEMQVADSTATPRDLFFSFQSSVIFVLASDYDRHEANDFAGNYIHTGDSLIIEMVPRYGSSEPLQEFMAARWGMPEHDNIRLRVEALDKKVMRLSREEDYWLFRKF